MSLFSKEQLESLPICGYSCADTSIVKLQASIGSDTNWLIIGWAEKDNLLFGYSCINGEKDLAEMDSFSIEELELLAEEHIMNISEPNISMKEAKQNI